MADSFSGRSEPLSGEQVFHGLAGAIGAGATEQDVTLEWIAEADYERIIDFTVSVKTVDAQATTGAYRLHDQDAQVLTDDATLVGTVANVSASASGKDVSVARGKRLLLNVTVPANSDALVVTVSARYLRA